MKKSMTILDSSLSSISNLGTTTPSTSKNAYPIMKVIDMHDEAQADVLEEFVEQYQELAEDSVVQAGEFFKLRCPMAAEAKVGSNWAETH